MNETTNSIVLTEEDKILLKEIHQKKCRCKYCGELAVGLNTSKDPVCDIPGNHPSEDCAIIKPEDL